MHVDGASNCPLDDLAKIGRKSIEGRAMSEQAPGAVEMAGHGDMRVNPIHPIGDRIGERILLGIHLQTRDEHDGFA